MGSAFLDLSSQSIFGESLDDNFKNQIQVLDWDWGLDNWASFEMRAQDHSSKTRVKHLTIYKGVDRASVTLAKFCALGKHIDTAVLSLLKLEGVEPSIGFERLQYFTLTMEQCMIRHIDWKNGEDGQVSETVTLKFKKFSLLYRGQNNPVIEAGDQLLGAVPFGPFNIPEHRDDDAEGGHS
jgi:type VI secretion system secreted protein Hcp